MTPMEIREKYPDILVTCSRCGLKQKPNVYCLKCEKNLPGIEIVEVPKEVFIPVDKIIVSEKPVTITKEIVASSLCPKCHLSFSTAEQKYVNPETREIAVDSFNLHLIERDTIIRAAKLTKGDHKNTPRILGIGKTTLYRKLKGYGLSLESFRERGEEESA